MPLRQQLELQLEELESCLGDALCCGLPEPRLSECIVEAVAHARRKQGIFQHLDAEHYALSAVDHAREEITKLAEAVSPHAQAPRTPGCSFRADAGGKVSAGVEALMAPLRSFVTEVEADAEAAEAAASAAAPLQPAGEGTEAWEEEHAGLHGSHTPPRHVLLQLAQNLKRLNV